MHAAVKSQLQSLGTVSQLVPDPDAILATTCLGLSGLVPMHRL